jgi:hypothetical protein
MNNADDRDDQPTQPIRIPAGLTDDMRSETASMTQDEIRTPPPLSSAEEFVTPPPLSPTEGLRTPLPPTLTKEAVSTEASRPKTSKLLWLFVLLSLVFSVTSCALSGYLIYSLLTVRQLALEGVDSAISALDGLEGKGFHYDYRFNESIPIQADIPIQQDIVFPFEGDFPINTMVEVPIDAGVLGTIVVEVPINTSFYVSTAVPIKVDQTFSVSTTIPVDMTIPVDVSANDPEIREMLEPVRLWLLKLRNAFVPLLQSQP